MRWARVAAVSLFLAVVSALMVTGCVATRYIYVQSDGQHRSAEVSDRLEIRVQNLRPATTQPAAATQPAQVLVGTWRGTGDWVANPEGDFLYLWLESQTLAGISQSQHVIQYRDVAGLPTSSPTGPTPAQFTIRRNAGQFVFGGQIAGRVGSGDVRFEPDPAFVAEVKSLVGEDLSPRRALDLMVSGLDIGYVRAIQEAGYKASLDQILAMDRHNVRADYAKAFREAGYVFTPEQIIDLDAHNVRADYARSFRSAGYEFAASELVELDRHNIRSDYAKTLREAGFTLDVKDLVNLDRHNIRADYARSLIEAGYKFSIAEIIELDRCNIRADYAKAVRQAGYNLSAQDLIELDRHNIRVDYAKAVREAGYDLSVKDLVELDRNNISTAFLAALHMPDRPNLSVADIVELSRKNIDPQTIRMLRGK